MKNYYIVAYNNSFDSVFAGEKITCREAALAVCKPGMRVLLVQETQLVHCERGTTHPQQRRTEVYRREE